MNTFESQLPKHKAGLSLDHNPHKGVYETVEQYVNGMPDYFDDECWATPTSKQRAIETNELWVIQWYPNTPVGFNNMAGATLDELLKAVKE